MALSGVPLVNLSPPVGRVLAPLHGPPENDTDKYIKAPAGDSLKSGVAAGRGEKEEKKRETRSTEREDDARFPGIPFRVGTHRARRREEDARPEARTNFTEAR